ncbi:MAG TPA: twin-arginine translocation signal domain-containing protein [Verrucomicrobiota bacterium]|jgi:predicted dehydrogenase|nr:twin-arginine translocation signal domain-containing protein [Verrucomicrobiota bacterium]HQL77122.1 twin-arginine translocation signal domain-containing protein [Verrucomicrobiota bacterium]
MNSNPSTDSGRTTRREFLKTSGTALAGAALASAIARPGYAAENNTLKLALVGCGGRGTGAAAQALSTRGPTRLWAVADVFAQRVQTSLASLRQSHEQQLDVPPERQFVGLDGFKKAIDSLGKGGVVLLATAPAFRPIHLEYAVQKGVHVFMEKSFAVDAPGTHRVLKAGEEASKKGLKIAGGLMSRHYRPLEEAIQKVHEGLIGDLVTCWAYRMHGPVGINPRQPGMNELAYQIANYSCFTWLNGSFLEDWLIHNIDVCCWAKNAWPVSVQGMGGRQVRRDPDQLFDHYAAEYTFADGTRFMAQGRHMTNCWDFFGNIIQGTKGSGVLGEGQPKPRLFQGYRQTTENLIWSYKGPPSDQYQIEHDLLFDAIRNDKPYNEAERCAKSCFTAIMGRMACESGKLVTWDEALASKTELAPGLDNYTWDTNPPTMPDAEGRYPIAMPGQTAAL